VTGGAGDGIGHGITEALIRQGWSVLVVDCDAHRATALKDRLAKRGKAIEVLAADITGLQTPAQAVDIALKKFGRLDGLVNNAGIGLCKAIADVEDQEFDRLLDIDLRASFRFCRASIPVMLSVGGGSIVNIGSVHARQSIRGFGLYACVKCAVEGLTRGLALDYGPDGIRANCIHPGLVQSPQNRKLIQAFDPDPERWITEYIRTKQLTPSLVTPRQVGELTAWLLGPQSQTLTAQAIALDGGSSAMLYERDLQ
jgi:NAD(P)-dependent dehydrogenase (short-subunit alcohol dehydrogenase family)